jgi:hypothetical protein
MDKLTYHPVDRQRRRELMGEAERERLAKGTRENSGKRANLSRGIGSEWEPKKLAGHLIKGLRAGKSES